MRNLLFAAALAFTIITLAVVFGNLQGVVFSVAGSVFGAFKMLKG